MTHDGVSSGLPRSDISKGEQARDMILIRLTGRLPKQIILLYFIVYEFSCILRKHSKFFFSCLDINVAEKLLELVLNTNQSIEDTPFYVNF